MTAARVDVTGLTWRPWGRHVPVLRDVDLRVEPGERVLLAGPSGAGKSTLLRALTGQLSADDGDLAGAVAVDGVSGLLLQDPTTAVVADRAGRDTAFGPENVGVPRDAIWRRVREALQASGFPYDEWRPTGALSGGEGQRLALAGALALRPGLLLLDEPTAMLDAPTAARVREAIVSVVEATGCTLVVVEHRMRPWLAHVDRLVVLSAEGEVVDDGPPAAVVAARGAQLTAAGLWLDDAAPAPTEPNESLEPSRPADPLAAPLLVARSAVGQPMTWRRGGPAARIGPVDATVAAGAVTAVAGPSGAGKSTVLALLAGLSRPVAGEVLAEPAWSPRAERRPHAWRSRELAARVSWLPQLPEHALVARTVREEVLATSRALHRPLPAAEARADELLDRLGLSSASDRDPHLLSGGEQRRLGLAAALTHDPGVVLLDEPTVGQDRLTWRAVLDLLLEALQHRDSAVVVASHDAQLLDALTIAAPTHRVDLGARADAGESTAVAS